VEFGCAAGGDGTQALVATVAAEAGLPFVCVPAGTRNHFALDLGLDRDDVVGALDAFADAVERPVDLARVNGRTFVNNCSMGLYAAIVQSDEYRDAKVETAAAMLPELLGPDADSLDLRFTDGSGRPRTTTHMLLVSNNPYVLDRVGGFGLDFEELPAGADHYRETGTALPEDSLRRAGEADAVLLGAMGLPSVRYPDGREIAPQLDLRETFELFAGLRPVASD